MPASEYIEWCLYLNLIEEENSKEEFYLAQIAAEVRRSFVKNPGGVKLTDFLFKVKKEQTFTLKEATRRAKQFFFALTGYKQKGRVR